MHTTLLQDQASTNSNQQPTNHLQQAISTETDTEISGELSKFLFNANGEVDGFLLDGLHQVHFPPHMATEVLKNVKLGETIKVCGDKPFSANLLIASSITGKDGTLIEINDEHHETA